MEVAENRGDASLAEAKRLAECDVARASGESRAQELLGSGEASRTSQVGQSGTESGGMFGKLLALMMAEKAGLSLEDKEAQPTDHGA